MNQKTLAKELKAQSKAISFRIQGHNIYLKDVNENGIDEVEKHLDSTKEELGYKRIFKIEKPNGRVLFGSVPFGICVTCN